jgi:hypothetical protein
MADDNVEVGQQMKVLFSNAVRHFVSCWPPFALDSRAPQAGEFAVRYAIPATYKLRRHATAGYPHQSNGRARGTSDAN